MMNILAATVILVAVLSGSSGSALAAADDEPREWLKRMSTAMSQMNYQGTFVYVQGDTVDSMRITHVSDQDGVRERLVSVSGAPREVLRDSSGVRWVLADDQSVFADSAFKGSFFPELPLDEDDQTAESYSLSLGGRARIAGHMARNLKVLPRDNYRYGYSLWLEEHSGLLLKWIMIDSNRKPLAKLMFTDLRLGSEVDVKELKSSSQLKKFKTVESSLPSGRGISQAKPRWQPAELPPGFSLTAHRYFGRKDQGIYEHLVYSDGLAAVSVYVESNDSQSRNETGLKRRGTTHAFLRITDDVLITVVGDVPAITVQSVADTVVPVSP